MLKKDVIIFDLDGTLSDPAHRLNLIKGGKKDFNSFFEACDKDKPKEDMVQLIQFLYSTGVHELWIVSGRSDQVRKKTEQWLAKHDIKYDNLVMRKQGDHTPDDYLKRSWLHDGTLPKKERILMCFDDRKRVVDMWRSEGLTCAQIDSWQED